MRDSDTETVWRPAASINTLRERAGLLAAIRGFFASRDVLEVETPVLSHAGTTDPNIESFTSVFQSQGAGRTLYLATSPEFHMKRLLAAGSGAIYQVSRVFRQGEVGRLHNPEFTLLEWYRPGYDLHGLMQEVGELVTQLLAPQLDPDSAEFFTYRDIFQHCLSVDPLTDPTAALVECAKEQGIDVSGLAPDDRDSWLDLLMSHCVQPQLGRHGLSFVYDYPASQASLANIRNGSPPVAERFELFVHGVELANGFHELQDATEQAQRFAKDQHQREQRGMPVIPADRRLVAALDFGLPDCSGVALGIDRLLQIKLGTKSIQDCLAFPVNHA